MLDKNELQELLVRLKLGTVSVDDAIETIDKHFYDETYAEVSLWNRRGFDEAIFCGDKTSDRIKSIIYDFLEKRTSFLCYGLDDVKISELAKVFGGVDFIYDAGIAFKIYEKASRKNANVLVVSSIDNSGTICREVETILDIMGIDCRVFGDVSPLKLLSMKNEFIDYSAIIVISDNSALASVAGSLFTGTVVWTPLLGDGSISGGAGICRGDRADGFSAAMAVFRAIH